MDTKTQDEGPRFQSVQRDHVNVKTKCDTLDKFSLIKARRRRIEQSRRKRNISKAKKHFKESKHSPIFETLDNLSAGKVEDETRTYEKTIDFEHFTIDLKRVGIDSNDEKIEDKLLASTCSIRHIFQKRLNISIPRIDSKDLTTLNRNGFIKTDTMNKENTPAGFDICNKFSPKNVVITPEHIEKIKSKLKYIAYEKSKAKSPTTNIAEEDSQDEVAGLPDLEDENHKDIFPRCENGLQPPTLVPEMACSPDSPIVYLETKPDVEELNRRMAEHGTPSKLFPAFDEEVEDKECGNLIHFSEGNHCRHLEVFVAGESTESTSEFESESTYKMNLMPLENEGTSIERESNKTEMCDKDMPISQAKPASVENKVPNHGSSLIISDSNSINSCKTSPINHLSTHCNSDKNSFPQHESYFNTSLSEGCTAKTELEKNMADSECETSLAQNGYESKNPTCNVEPCLEGLPLSSKPLNESNEGFGPQLACLTHVTSSTVEDRFPVAKEPSETACVNGYDSDATYVYDDEEYEREEAKASKLAKEELPKTSYSNGCSLDSDLNVKDRGLISKLKKTNLKKISSCDSKETSNCKTLLTDNNVSEKKKKITNNRLKVKFKAHQPRRKKQMQSKMEDNSKDLTLTISPRKKGISGMERKKASTTPKKVIQLHDVFQFDDNSDGEVEPSLKRNDVVKENSAKNKPLGRRKRKLTTQKRKTNPHRWTNTIQGATDITDEDDLPKILPPKRRRNARSGSLMKTKPVLATNDMERLIQEFPRHNWLEHKYRSDETTKGLDLSQEVHTSSPEVHEYSLNDSKMQSTESTGEHLTEKTRITPDGSVDSDPVTDKCVVESGVVTSPPGACTSPSPESVDKQEDYTECEDRLQIVTDEDQTHQEMEIRIASEEERAPTDEPSENLENNEITEKENTIEEEVVTPCDTNEMTTSVEEHVDNNSNNLTSTENALPPVPLLIRSTDASQGERMESYDEMNFRGVENGTAGEENQITVVSVCSSLVGQDNVVDLVSKSFSSRDSTSTVTTNVGCIVSTNRKNEPHVVNSRKRRLVDCNDMPGQNNFVNPPDNVPLKSPKTQVSSIIDIDNFKEIIAARVKHDIDNQLKKTLKEFQELDQLALEKAREAESLKMMRENKLKDLQKIQQNNSEIEIKRILNEKLLNLDRHKESNLGMNSPPPAHQRPKQNIRELLDKMDRSHSQTPIDGSKFSAFSTRKTPLHSPKSCVDGVVSNSAHPKLPSMRNDASRNEARLGYNIVPQAHVTEHNVDIRASSAPVSYYNRNGSNHPVSFSEGRQSASHKPNLSVGTRIATDAKQSVISSSQGSAFIDLSQRNTDSEVEIQRELSRALAAKRQKQETNIKNDGSKSREESVIRKHHQNEEAFSARPNVHPPNAQLLHNTNSNDVRMIHQYPQNAYSNQFVRPVSYGGLTNPQTVPLNRVTDKGVVRHIGPGMIRPHAVRLVGAQSLGNGQQVVDGRPTYHSFAPTIPRNTFPNTGSIQQGTPIRPMPGIVSPTQSNVRAPFPNGMQGLENGQILRHIPITAARTADNPHRDTYVQQVAVSSLRPPMRQRTYLRPLAPAPSSRAPPDSPQKVDPITMEMPHTTDVQIRPSPQQLQPSMHMNVNGKCIVCSKFALYLCSKCQQFWYCSPQCQLKHWVTHQHECKNTAS